MNLSTLVEEIPGIGPQFQKRLKKLGIKTLGDLLYHFPHRYEDFSNLITISQAKQEGIFSFQAKILEIKNIRTFRKKMVLTQATVGDETGRLKVVWFNQPYLINNFKKGDWLCLSGKISGKGKVIYLSNPTYEKIGKEKLKMENFDLTHTGRLVPVYPETEGLSSRWLRFIIKPILMKLKNKLLDPLPEKIRKKYNFLPLEKALWQIHFPQSLKMAESAKKRFAFEELFFLSLFILREKRKLTKEKAISLPINLEALKEFVTSLSFTLTDSQKKAAWQILKDMEKPRPMNRLLEGDVGSGKTVVATIAALNVAKNQFQTAIMAPTEILAKQHYKTISNFLEKFNLKIGLITAKENFLNGEKIKRKELLEKVEKGEVDILIGTHAIIQDTTPKTKVKTPVQFKKLALVIIDEQHRFGVEQRAKLCQQKEFIPHLLSMTATPIPRTLSLTIYGDLDLSIIDELPKGRKKVITKIVRPEEKKEVYNFVRKEVKEGKQVFVICPRIEPPKSRKENIDGQLSILPLDEKKLSWQEVKAAKEEYEKLSKEIFPDLRVGLLHGRMKTEEKEKVMEDFKNGKIDILVSTAVVEVGVDIPNATVMLIEGSEKFGLAQLHQFRGRIGRGEAQSYCFLLTESFGKYINQRLKALISCQNGFELAEKDLAIRGPGDFLGSRQWGLPDLTMASLTDVSLIEKAREEANEILNEDPELKKYPLLQKKLDQFRKKVHLE